MQQDKPTPANPVFGFTSRAADVFANFTPGQMRFDVASLTPDGTEITVTRRNTLGGAMALAAKRIPKKRVHTVSIRASVFVRFPDGTMINGVVGTWVGKGTVIVVTKA